MCPDSVESEQHVLLSCPLYDDVRLDLFSCAGELYPEFRNLGDNDKLEILMSSQNLARVTARTCRLI